MKRSHLAAVVMVVAVSSLAGCSAETPTVTGGPPPSAGAPSVEASRSPAGKYVTEIGSCLDVPYGQPYAVRTPCAHAGL